MLADSWDLLTKENLKKRWNKLWPDNKETGEDNENEARMAEMLERWHIFASL